MTSLPTSPSPKSTPERAFNLTFKPVHNGLVVSINGDLHVAKTVDEALDLVRYQMYQQLSQPTQKESA